MTNNASVGKFMRLDHLTVRHRDKGGYWVMLIMVGLMAVVFQNIAPIIGVLVFILQPFATSPFDEADMYNMDALYVMLNIKRRTVVMGRYIRNALLMLGGVILALAATGIALIVERIFEIDLSTHLALPMMTGMIFTQILGQLAQIPIFFKLGPRSITGWVQLPMVILFIGVGFLISFVGVERLAELAPFIAAAGIAILIAGVILSFRLSVKFYTAREF